MWWRTKKKPLQKPTHIDLTMPHQCMLRCKMCEIWKLYSTQQEDWLTFEKYSKLLHDLKEHIENSFLINFSGGETLLYSDKLLKIIKKCDDLGFLTYFPTNAYLIDENMAKKIRQAKVYALGISLDGINKKTHDFIRGKDSSWERAMAAIEHLKGHSPDTLIYILVVIMDLNLDEIIEMTNWVYNNPSLYRIAFQVVQKPFAAQCPDDWYNSDKYVFLWPKDLGKLNFVMDELIALRELCSDGFKISNPASQLKQFKSYFINPEAFLKPGKCHMDNVMRVDIFGNVRMCEEIGILGNIKEDNIWNIWTSEKTNEARERISVCKKNCHYLINCYYTENN